MVVMDIAENIKEIKSEIADAAESVGRKPSDIKLIAVSKTKPTESLREAYSIGQRDFGENKPQEIVKKFGELEYDDVKFHMIGHLQKNKVKTIIDKVCLIHSVDSRELAEEINKRAGQIGKIQDILIQVNVSGEESKFGVSPEVLTDLCKEISKLPNVRIKGLMTISVKGMTYDENKAVFDKLKSLSEDVARENIENVAMEELSMGMTHDYVEAIAAGSTMIRVGTAIFGERDYSAM